LATISASAAATIRTMPPDASLSMKRRSRVGRKLGLRVMGLARKKGRWRPDQR
jgi:hypothetical protein